jgi:hypothetical protein
MSCLGIAFDMKGWIFRPFYLCLGALYFIVLLSLLGALYILIFIKNTLEKILKDIKKQRKKYSKLV